MKKNVIILTSGLSGSSVLTGLISRAGYWTGDRTFKKADYETHENRELIDLNLRLFAEAEYRGNYLLEFSPAAIRTIGELDPALDDGRYREFVARCNQHQPWIWKDPRLWVTMRFWKNLLDLETCSFIVLGRGSVQSWISSTLRRQITSYRYSKHYEDSIRRSIVEFLEEHRQPYLDLTYEELIQRPAEAIRRLNGHLGTALSVDDLKAVYHKPLYKSPRNSLTKSIKAILIYLKNYSQRLDIVTERE